MTKPKSYLEQRKDSITSDILTAVGGGSLGTLQLPSGTDIYAIAYQEHAILRRVIDYKAEKATGIPPVYYKGEDITTDNNKNTQLQDKLEEIELIGCRKNDKFVWSTFWTEALRYADLFGNSYVIIGDESAKEAESAKEPLPDDAKITYLAIRLIGQLSENADGTYRMYSQSNLASDEKETLNQQLIFHPSRVIKLAGIRKLSSTASLEKDISVLAPLLEKYHGLTETYCNTNEMVKNHSFFVLKMHGLAGVQVRNGKASMKQRFQDIMTGLKNMGGLLIDDKEEANVVNRNYSGLDKIIAINIDWFVAQCGMPKSFITGIQQTGSMSDASKSDMKLLAALVADYQHLKYKPAIRGIVAYKAAEIGLEKPEISFHTTYQMDAKEELEVAKMEVEVELLKKQLEAPLPDPNQANNQTNNNQKDEKENDKDKKSNPK